MKENDDKKKLVPPSFPHSKERYSSNNEIDKIKKE